MPRIIREDKRQIGDALGAGVELVGTIVVFFFLGWGLDAWLGTRPLFMVSLTVLAMVGKLILVFFHYKAAMERHEAELRRARQA